MLDSQMIFQDGVRDPVIFPTWLSFVLDMKKVCFSIGIC